VAIDLSVNLGKLTLQNPVLTASGTFGYGDDFPEIAKVNQLGGIITKSLTGEPRSGNMPPRIVEVTGGMLNSIGLANIGVDDFVVSRIEAVREKVKVPVIVNIAGSSKEEYSHVLERLSQIENLIDGYEINISCPNIERGGMEFGVNPKLTEDLVKNLRKLTEKFLMVKLSPNVTDIGEIASAAQEGGADSISAINTVVGMVIDIRKKKPVLSTVTGGFSGPAIKPIALASIFKITRRVSIPVVGVGGITSGSDILEFIMGGATAVQIGTANFIHPDAAVRILHELREICDSMNLTSIREVCGCVHQ
jgi:dihydroorotate dehydrogenase (NAD+) catalytic subunit